MMNFEFRISKECADKQIIPMAGENFVIHYSTFVVEICQRLIPVNKQ